jgi:hypothetical protein
MTVWREFPLFYDFMACLGNCRQFHDCIEIVQQSYCTFLIFRICQIKITNVQYCLKQYEIIKRIK